MEVATSSLEEALMKPVVLRRPGLHWEPVQSGMPWVGPPRTICLIQTQSSEKVSLLFGILQLGKAQLQKKPRKKKSKEVEERPESGEEPRTGSWELRARNIERGLYLASRWCSDIREDGGTQMCSSVLGTSRCSTNAASFSLRRLLFFYF